MMKEQKEWLLQQAKEHLISIREKIAATIQRREAKSKLMAKNAISMLPGDALTERRLMAHNQEKLVHLEQLYPSPYFTRCDFEMQGEKRTLYFGKFSFSEEGIYSWITPAATLRFENPGSASYIRPDGTKQTGTITRKDTYLIVEGALLFFATDHPNQPRELIYQEHFTRHKQGFVLPEVVELMEKAQDTIIRAPHQGPLVISGPAGSGKTTLALHRVAYLMQSPETMDFFPPESILVLVQDTGTKEYFAGLLPELGIKGVVINTFAEWAQAILKLINYSIITYYYQFEDKRILYENAKLQALRNPASVAATKNIYAELEKIYQPFFLPEHAAIFDWQKKERLLDRFDLTILLHSHHRRHQNFTVEKEYYEELNNGNYRKRTGSFELAYNLAIIDEFQNYLPEQIQLLNHCINPRLQSLVYAGDLAQQTRLGTIRHWNSVSIEIKPERIVRLQKVYRNTREILSYLKQIGYVVVLPEQAKAGKPVIEALTTNPEEEIAYIATHLPTSDATVGILARNIEYLTDFKNRFKDHSSIRCLSYYEAQGVEFDCVFMVGVDDAELPEKGTSPELLKEIMTIEKDLLYVALTRAMSELHILGKIKLEQVLKSYTNF